VRPKNQLPNSRDLRNQSKKGNKYLTLCIACECEHEDKEAFVSCCDFQAGKVSAYGQTLISSEDVYKMRDFAGFSILISGSETLADELISLCEEPILRFQSSPQKREDSDIHITKFLSDLRSACQVRKKKILDHYVSMKWGFIDHEDFLKRVKATFTDQHYNQAWTEISQIDLGTELIISGFYDEESVIVRLDQVGNVHWETHYSVIGAGSDIALAFLCQYDLDELVSLQQCLYLVLQSKMAAEHNPDVGKDTAFEIYVDGQKDPFDITDEGFQKLKMLIKLGRFPKSINLGNDFLKPSSSIETPQPSSQ